MAKAWMRGLVLGGTILAAGGALAQTPAKVFRFATSTDAATLDPELQALNDAGRDRWPELYGRTAGLQLTLNKATLPEELEGWCLEELAKAFASADWSAIDIGAAFEQTRARMRCEKFVAGPADKAYTNRRSIESRAGIGVGDSQAVAGGRGAGRL
jgi:hypothetical protein